MSKNLPQHSKGKLPYFQGNQKCRCCEDLSKKFESYKDASEKRYNALFDILAEQKVLLDRIVSQNAVVDDIMGIFPISTEEKLKELDNILATQADPYIRQMKVLLGGNAERNLHQVFGKDIIMNFNVDGTFGKKRFRDYGNVFAGTIDVISTYSDTSDHALRAAFQRQKKKYFKQTSRSNNNKQQMLKGSASLEGNDIFNI